MKDDFKLTINIKNMNSVIYDVVKKFPKNEKIIRDGLLSDSIDLLRNTYKANYLDIKDSDRLKIQYDILTNIRMIDYYLELGINNGLIGDKNIKIIGKYLAFISKMVKSWIQYTKNNIGRE